MNEGRTTYFRLLLARDGGLMEKETEMTMEEVDLVNVINQHNAVVDLLTGIGIQPSSDLALGLIMAGLALLVKRGMRQGDQMKIVQTTINALQSLQLYPVKVKEGN